MSLLETERLILRPWEVEDAEGAFAMYGDPEVVRHIGGHVEASVDSTRDVLATIIERSSVLPAGMGSFPMIEKASGRLVGTGMLKPLPGLDSLPTKDIEIGWHLVRAEWGRGFATEAARGLLRHGFEALDLTEIHAVVEPPNEPSHRVARRLDMEDRGITTSYYGGKELRHYSLLRESLPVPAAGTR